MATSEETLEWARIAAQAATELKATTITAIGVSERLVLAEVFLVVSGSSDRQVRSLVDTMDEALLKAGVRRKRREGFDEGHWVLVDYGDLVVHVQQDEDRDFYALEHLWVDCPSTSLSVEAPRARALREWSRGGTARPT